LGLKEDMKRREFLRTAVVSGSLVLADQVFSMSRPSDQQIPETFPKRVLGKTGRKLSIIGFGGIVVMNADPEHAKQIVAEHIEKGINYFDVAPAYGDAELKLGPAIKPYRDRIFLACKTGKRDKAGAKEELDNSLKRLQTDHLDLYQLHAITDVEKDVKAALSKDGAIQTFIEARKAGIIKYIGFSAHSPQAAMLAMQEFDFDTILYPINFCTHFRSKFEEKVLIEAKKRNMGILALKALARQKWQSEQGKRQDYKKCWYEPIDDPQLAKLALSWTLSQGITAALPPGEEKPFRMAVELAPDCKKLSDTELAELENASKILHPLFTARG
jgi:aryl-alcohol dehydrogenase-like predicted oxidoreductase